MHKLISLVALAALAVGAAPAAATEELRRVSTTVEVGDNTVTLDRLVKYVEYKAGETLAVTLNYTATCNVVLADLALRPRNGFTPRVVTGTLENVSGATAGEITFDLTFATLRKAGQKEHGKAHLTLELGVDSDCDPETGDDDGVDDTIKVPVKISVSTVDHP
jgi:hypothetical protein